jgi:simple sugar transport system permease protein
MFDMIKKRLLPTKSIKLPNSDFPRLLGIAAFVFIAMAMMRPRLFLTIKNFVSMSFQIPELSFYSIAMMMVMLTGGRDLSIVNIGNLASIIAAFIMHEAVVRGVTGGAVWGFILLALFVALAVGVVCGAINGMVVANFGIPSMLATMATSGVFLGIGIVMTKGEAVAKVPAEFLYFGSNTFLGIPIPLLVLLLSLGFTSFLLNRTKFGFEAKMVGSNETASHYAGIDTKRVLVKAYMYSGLMCAICGLEILARTDTAKADYAFTYTFQAILAAVLGATNPNGGSAKVSCLVLSLISLQFLSSGFNMLRLGGFFKEFTWGLLLITVLSMDYLIERARKRRGVKAVTKVHRKQAS